MPTKLGASLQQANHDLSKLIQANNSLDGMGCTLIGAHISSEGLRWISVGDSLLYLYRNGKLVHLNADHSMSPVIEESYRAGKITKEEALAHPNKNALRSAVMGADIPLIDSPKNPMQLFHGDILIVASDGLLTLPESKICDILGKSLGKTAGELAKVLVGAVDAVNKPHQDNTTIQILIAPNSFVGGNRFIKKMALLALVLTSFVFIIFAVYLANPIGLLDKFAIDLVTSKDPAYVPQPVPLPSATQTVNTIPLPAVQEADNKNNSAPEAKKSNSTKPETNRAKPLNAGDGRNKKSDETLKSPSTAAPEPGGSMAAAGGLESPVTGSAGVGGTQSQDVKTQSDKKPQPSVTKTDPQGEQP